MMTVGDRERLKMSMEGGVLWCSSTSKISSPLGCMSLHCNSAHVQIWQEVFPFFSFASACYRLLCPTTPHSQSFNKFSSLLGACTVTSSSFSRMAEMLVKYVREDWALIPGPPPADPDWFCSSDLVASVLFCNSYNITFRDTQNLSEA